MRPVAQTDGHDFPGHIDELVPCVTAMVEDVVVGFEDTVRQPVVAQELPGVLDRVTSYNFRRPHQAMNNQMPMAVWHAGVDAIEAAAKIVDMPLRLDNANALPTYPQQKQKQQEAA